MRPRFPERIVCLTEETTEALYLMGEERRIVGISGFTVRPERARVEKPKVSAFTSAKIDTIVALQPDLVLGFSDLQSKIAEELIRRGLQVHIFNQRTIDGIFDMIAMLGAMIGEPGKAETLVGTLRAGVDETRRSAAALPRHPRVYFEEWGDPLISGIGWVSALIEVAGGHDCFPERAKEWGAKERIIADPSEVVRRAPDIIIGSWCGRKFQPSKVRARPGWDQIPAVRNGHLYEIKSSEILQPGPAALTDGVQQLHAIVRRWAEAQNA
jgi:iron complex transport system substrate-binding protein